MPLRLFEGYGVELEYMIVDAATLDVRPIADRVLEAKAGQWAADVSDGQIGWSNELVLHVLEFKTNGPAAQLEPTLPHFRRAIHEANALAAQEGARLLPTAMHPWMDPGRETQLWPHEYGPVYQAFDRIFGCSGHGWSNLQSTHLNLPFGDDEEFGRLHAAIRAVLPLLSPLAASSPIVEGQITGVPDNRLDFYRANARRVPSVTGEVIPEPVYTRRAYEQDLLGRIYRDLEPHDPQGILREEWVNARGAIARFDRDAIEIRVLDIQECPTADLAILALVTAAVRALAEERWVSLREVQALSTSVLARAFVELAHGGFDARMFGRGNGAASSAPAAVVAATPEERAQVAAWLAAFGMRGDPTVREVWTHLLEDLSTRADSDPLREGGPLRSALEHVLREGSLAERIVKRSGRKGSTEPCSRDQLHELYAELADCLSNDRLFP